MQKFTNSIPNTSKLYWKRRREKTARSIFTSSVHRATARCGSGIWWIKSSFLFCLRTSDPQVLGHISLNKWWNHDEILINFEDVGNKQNACRSSNVRVGNRNHSSRSGFPGLIGPYPYDRPIWRSRPNSKTPQTHSTAVKSLFLGGSTAASWNCLKPHTTYVSWIM